MLDVYHREFFERATGDHELEKSGMRVVETKTMHGNRLRVTLTYPSPAKPDVFQWQLYTPAELIELAASIGFKSVLACSHFDENVAASGSSPRMQLVLERE